MHVLHCLFAKGLGGIEQSFIDHTEAMLRQGWRVTCLVHPSAQTVAVLRARQWPHLTLRNVGHWDMLARWRLRRLVRQVGPEVVLTHGNRALRLLAGALRGQQAAPPLLTVVHNPRTRHAGLAEGVLAVTQRLVKQLQQQGLAPEYIRHVPNMLSQLPPLPAPTPQQPPVIGTLARCVPEKDLPTLLQALAALRGRGIAFRAVIGGDGPLKAALEQQAAALGLADILHFPGWVRDKSAFYAGLEVFCLSSAEEAFGIVLLEAMAHGLPVVSTAAPGPAELLEDGVTGLLCPVGDAAALADRLQRLLEDATLRQSLRQAGRLCVESHYHLPAVAPLLTRAIEELIDAHHAAH